MSQPAASTDRLSLAGLRRQLTTDVLGQHMYLFGSADSTSAVLRRLAERGAGEGTVVLAQGRQDLHVSVLFRPRLLVRDVSVFTQMASLALDEAIAGEAARGSTHVEYAAAEGLVRHVILGIDVTLDATRAHVECNTVMARLLNALEKWNGVLIEHRHAGRD